ncbi:MAG: flagellar hook-length control protein FliK, partial [Clostridia bacterium]|nr:flagellar hook-length control protein FliK [Clostridia bacterium]
LQPSLNNEPIISNLFTENQPIARFFNDTGQNQVVKEPEITPKELPNFILKQISNNFKFNKLTGTSELSIRLRPEELGKVTLQLLSQDGQLSVKIITENIRSMEIVEQNLAHLKQTLANQGIKCTEIEVQVNTDSTFNQFMGQQQNAFNHTRHNLRNKANYLGAYGKNEITLEGVGKEETMSFVRRNPDGLELFA